MIFFFMWDVDTLAYCLKTGMLAQNLFSPKHYEEESSSLLPTNSLKRSIRGLTERTASESMRETSPLRDFQLDLSTVSIC